MSAPTDPELLRRAGLNPNDWEERSFAVMLNDGHPAVGVYSSIVADATAVVREVPSLGGSVATLSRSPWLAMAELTRTEQERLRGESETAAGAKAPVGQEAAIEADMASRVGDSPSPPVLPQHQEPPPVLTACDTCGSTDGHEDDCPYWMPDLDTLTDKLPEGWA